MKKKYCTTKAEKKLNILKSAIAKWTFPRKNQKQILLKKSPKPHHHWDSTEKQV